jgi:hypothetical protein
MIAPFVLDGPINRSAFETYVERVLVPELRQGDIIVMDNLSSHKGPKVREMIEAAGASLLFLPPYSPDFNPIENAFASSRRCSAKPRSEPSTACGPRSDSSSISSTPSNVETTSPPQDTMQRDRPAL